jgi:inner membrane protein
VQASQKSLVWRIVVIALLTLVLLIPLGMIHGVVASRESQQQMVEQTIAQSSSGPQVLSGPLLIVPYAISERVTAKDAKGREFFQWETYENNAVFLPEKLVYETNVGVEEKYKSLYKALIYQSRGNINAEYLVPRGLGLEIDPASVTKKLSVGKAFLAIGLSDVRGLRGTPELKWDGGIVNVQNGSRWSALREGIHAPLGVLDLGEAKRYAMTMKLDFGGTRALAIAPSGKSTTVRMTSPWPHPDFGGQFLPTSRTIGADGFRATWEVSQLASKNAASFSSLIKPTTLVSTTPLPPTAEYVPTGETALLRTRGDASGAAAAPEVSLESFAVSFIEPVNIYLQSERAVKYGVLFIALTFASFFLFETMKSLRVHPLQYGLVGVELALFFLLLVSLSEHVRFLYAYLIASAASVILLSYYLAYVMRGWRRGLGFGVKLALLYAVLYGLILSEDNALMLGSILLFAVLAAVMLLTRKIDWYRLDFAESKD